jgi:hypothetical protein
MDKREIQNERSRRFNKRDREQAKDKGEKDATRVMRLSEAQLMSMYSRMNVIEVDDHGLGPGFEDYACEYADIQMIPAKSGILMLQRVYITQRDLVPSPFDNKDIKKRSAFSPGQVVLAVNGSFPENKTDECSHLCDNNRCIRFEHLVWESSKRNQNRKGCAGTVQCNCCTQMHDVCKHEPKCIKITGME